MLLTKLIIFPGISPVRPPVWPFLDQGVYCKSTAASDALWHLLMRDAECQQKTDNDYGIVPQRVLAEEEEIL